MSVPVAWADMANSERIGAADGDQMVTEAGVLLRRMSRWTEASWAVPVDGRSRADLAFALVQRLADISADAEHQPHRVVPRLDAAMLPDQLTVMVHDVLRTGSPTAWRAGLDAVLAARAILFG